MKPTAAAVVAIFAVSALANTLPYEEAAVYARDLYERDGDEAFLQLFEKRARRGGGAPSLSKSFANAAGVMGGHVAGNVAQLALSRTFTPPAPAPPQRRSLEARARRGGGPSLSRSISRTAGNVGGFVAAQAISNALNRPPPNPIQRRAVQQGRPSHNWAPTRAKGKGIAVSFLNGVAQGISARGLKDELDELD